MKLKTQLVSLINRITIFITLFGFRPSKVPDDFERLGTQYGGWWIPKQLRKKTDEKKSKRILVSAGIGEDVSFDLEMLNLNFELIALDPVPRCVEFAHKNIPSSENHLIIQKGLWDKTGNSKFFAPKKIEK